MTRRYNGQHTRVARANLPWRCDYCGTRKRLEVHHRNRDEQDNRPENLQVLCRYHHLQVHGKTPRKLHHYGPLWETVERPSILWIWPAIACLVLLVLLAVF